MRWERWTVQMFSDVLMALLLCSQGSAAACQGLEAQQRAGWAAVPGVTVASYDAVAVTVHLPAGPRHGAAWWESRAEQCRLTVNVRGGRVVVEGDLPMDAAYAVSDGQPGWCRD